MSAPQNGAAPYRSGMDFGVLGPLVVTARGDKIEVPGAKERTLLAHLLAYAAPPPRRSRTTCFGCATHSSRTGATAHGCW